MTDTTTTTSSDNTINLEATLDKFATLFSPATPRASPTRAAVSLPDDGESLAAAAQSQRPSMHSRRTASTGSADDFGAFVSVPASEDPLAAFATLDSPSIAFAAPASSSNNATPTKRISASLDFFDKFAQDAKLASERNKHEVLDELLLHEDDPLYWLKDTSDTTTQAQSEPEVDDEPELEFGDMVQAQLPKNEKEESLLDLGFDDDLPPPKAESTRSSNISSASSSTTPAKSKSPSSSPTRHPSRLSNASYPQLARRRSSSLHPPTLAPPIASTPSVISTPLPTPGGESSSDSEYGSAGSPPRAIPIRSPSYQTLSSLSSKWMSSFISSTRQSAPTNTLESLFAPLASSSSASSNPIPSHHNASTSPARHPPPPQHASTFSFSSSSSIPSVQISHGTPFAPSTHSSASPFAPHVYIPPTGAPGYAGEQYNWDKGFSEELQHELALASEAGDGVEMAINGKGKDVDVQGTMTVTSVGGFMEKKSGSIELVGRRESTVEVLSTTLADLIRPHLPALSRLSRKWNLLYSLDQHGISLNTLYDRCERLGQTKPGAGHHQGTLVVVKDTGNAVFGAWMGEGIRLNKGRGYYGSGESFLWQYVHHELKIFKWTGKNDYVALCEPEYISFGGGDGHYGLYLDDTLFEGSSARCPTFDNDPLCSPGPKKAGAIEFECVGLEVWGVGS